MRFLPHGTLLLFALAASSCANTINTYSTDKRLITDGWLSAKAQVGNVRTSRVSGNLLSVQVDVRNLKNSGDEFNYKFEWIDEAGSMLDSSTDVWKRQYIGPQEQIALTATATSPKAADFRLKLIQAQ